MNNTQNTRPAAIFDRRQWLTSATMAAGALAVIPAAAPAQSNLGVSHTAEAIHQEAVFKASPKRVYEALLDASQFQKVQLISFANNTADITAKPAVISREPGGSFLLFGGYITGRQLELLPNQRIVQAWRVGSWDPGAYSIVRFDLSEQGSGTKLSLDHTGFPAGLGEHLAEGWKSHYFDSLEKFLA